MEAVCRLKCIDSLQRSVVHARMLNNQRLLLRSLVANLIRGCQNGFHEKYGDAFADSEPHGAFRLRTCLTRNLNVIVDAVADERLFPTRQIIQDGFARITRFLKKGHRARLEWYVRS